jgi:hypothetical protein
MSVILVIGELTSKGGFIYNSSLISFLNLILNILNPYLLILNIFILESSPADATRFSPKLVTQSYPPTSGV